MSFSGYTDQTFEFFMALRFNNNRAFFLDNRDWYLQSVREPSLELCKELATAMQQIDPLLETRPHRVVARINRDVRFSRDKSPYRDHIWLCYRRPEQERGVSPGFYFETDAQGAYYGMGFYLPNRPLMNALRRADAHCTGGAGGDFRRFKRRVFPLRRGV